MPSLVRWPVCIGRFGGLNVEVEMPAALHGVDPLFTNWVELKELGLVSFSRAAQKALGRWFGSRLLVSQKVARWPEVHCWPVEEHFVTCQDDDSLDIPSPEFAPLFLGSLCLPLTRPTKIAGVLILA